jgi:hypothetical protein
VREGAEEERVESGANSLIEDEFDDCIRDGELWGRLVLGLLLG